MERTAAKLTHNRWAARFDQTKHHSNEKHASKEWQGNGTFHFRARFSSWFHCWPLAHFCCHIQQLWIKRRHPFIQYQRLGLQSSGALKAPPRSSDIRAAIVAADLRVICPAEVRVCTNILALLQLILLAAVRHHIYTGQQSCDKQPSVVKYRRMQNNESRLWSVGNSPGELNISKHTQTVSSIFLQSYVQTHTAWTGKASRLTSASARICSGSGILRNVQVF